MIRLCKVLSVYRLAGSIPLRDLAREIGIDYSVLSKFERGRSSKEATLAKIITWLLSKDLGDCSKKRPHGGWQPGQSGNPEGSRRPSAWDHIAKEATRRIEQGEVVPYRRGGSHFAKVLAAWWEQERFNYHPPGRPCRWGTIRNKLIPLWNRAINRQRPH